MKSWNKITENHLKDIFIICLTMILVGPIGTANAANVNITANITDGVNSLAFNQDGVLASARDDGRVTLWNPSTGSIIRDLRVNYSIHIPTGQSAITGLVFSTDGKTLATSSLDSVARIWNVSSGVLGAEYKGHEEGVLSTAISPDGLKVATGGEDTKVMVWDVPSSRLKSVLEGHRNFVRSVTFGSNTILASGSDDGTVKLWNISNGKVLFSLDSGGGVNIIAFSPDKTVIATGTSNGIVKEWNAATGQLIRTYLGGGASVNAISYAPIGNILVTAGDDGIIRVWNRNKGSLIISLNTKTKIRSLAYSYDSKSIATAGAGNTINLWNTTTWALSNLTDVNISISVPRVNNVNNGNGNIGNNRNNKQNGNLLINNNAIIKSTQSNVGIQALNEGSGGPILIITSTSSSNPFGSFYSEILRTEGFNAFHTEDINAVTPTILSQYVLVILTEMTLTPTQVNMLSDWVNSGGRLIAMRPDSQLSGLLGITGPSGTLNGNGSYLLINNSDIAGNGLVGQTIQFKGTANLYGLNGANTVATLYSDANTMTNNPAVTIHNAGNGQAAAFTYDLAQSIIYLRQGNPAWEGTERDGYPPIRSDDMYYGNASNSERDWVDLNKVAIPQADEQQRLLTNIIITMTMNNNPLPRFWYLPRGIRAAIVMTGDDHANGGTPGRFDQYIALSPTDCSVNNWTCIRSTSYIYPENNFFNNSQAFEYQKEGFEVGIHVQSNCADYTPDELDTYYRNQIDTWRATYPDLNLPHTHRMHCIAWDGWSVQPSTEINHSILFDTSYYYWPPSWIADRPGFFTGSGMPMRFSDLKGNLINVYQAESQMTDESGQSYPYTSNSLLDKAIGPEQYFGAFTVNAHTDVDISYMSDAVVRSALIRGIPIISSSQLLDWLNGRENSSYSNINWNGSVLQFSVTDNANGLQVMVPISSNKGKINNVMINGNRANYSVQTIKGIDYAFIGATTGTYSVTYSPDFSLPMVIGNSPGSGIYGVGISVPITATFNKNMDASTINASTIQLLNNGNIIPASISYDATTLTARLQPLDQLKIQTTYSVIINGGSTNPRVRDIAGNSLEENYVWSFTTASGPVCPCSIWNPSAIPGTITQNDPNPVELGLKFQSDTSGYITGVKFYKGPFNKGNHVGTLWDNTGNKLTSANFTNESASGWQQASFDIPVLVNAGTTYVVSYHTDDGFYSADNYYFLSSGFDNYPLHALKSGVGGNGVYAYSTTPTFPNNAGSYTNYWVDVVYSTDRTVTPVPINLVSNQDKFWVNYTWQPGLGGNIVDSYNVSINGTWTNGSSHYINSYVGPHNWSNIMVYGYNNSYGQLSLAPATMNTRIANNIPILGPINNQNVSAGQILEFNVHATDVDNDTLIYGTNASKGIFNSTTGNFSWITTNDDIGNYTWYFSSNDGYDGIVNETVSINVNKGDPLSVTSFSPSTDPTTIYGNLQTFNISLNRNANITWYINNSVVQTDNVSNMSNYTNSSSDAGMYNVTVIATDGIYTTSEKWNWTINSQNPNIISWGNSKTKDENITLVVNTGEEVNFNASANQPIITWNWYRDDLNQNNSFDNISVSWNTSGTNTVSINATNTNGTSNIITWTITVINPPKYIPPLPIIGSTVGNFWINTTWQPGIGNMTDSYNVSVNGIYDNGTTNTSVNNTITPHGWQNVTINAFNKSGGGSLSTSYTEYVQIPNNLPLQDQIGNKKVNEGQNLAFTVSARDIDNDSIIYSTNATKGDFNTTSGQFSWSPLYGEAGIYVWNFNSTDSYGGVASETIMVTVNESSLYITDSSPSADPTTIVGNPQNFSIGLNRIANVTWYINGSIVQTSSNNISNYTNYSANTGIYNVTVVATDGFYSISNTWSWIVNPTPVYPPEITSYNNSKTKDSNTFLTISTGEIVNFNALANQTITSWNWYEDGMNQINNYDNITISWNTVGTYTIVVNATNSNGTSNSVTWVITVQQPSSYIPPDPTSLNNTTGNFWINYTWVPGSGNITDSYNVSVNGIWNNGTAKFKNTTTVPHGWENITVWAYNSSGIMSTGNVNKNTQVPNNPPIQSPIGNKTITAGNLLNITIIATDLDNDTIIYGTNATKGALDNTTGIYSWQTTSNDNGTYIWYFNSADSFGGIGNETITINVTPNIIPMVVGNVPSSGAQGVNRSTLVTAKFNEAMNSSTINMATFELHMNNETGPIVPASISYNNSSYIATLTPSNILVQSTNYTAVVKGGNNDPRVKDLVGNSLAINFIWSFATSPCPCSIWNTSVIPGTITVNDRSASELGVKFRSDVNGSITGIRFYKGPSNTGTHVGTIWSNTGTQLGRVTFSGETASGWQQANFSSPINVTAGTIYVASYHTNTGNYSDNNNYFATSGFDNPPLHALKNGVSGTNGVYIYSATPKFPNKGYLSTNYWIDIVFATR